MPKPGGLELGAGAVRGLEAGAVDAILLLHQGPAEQTAVGVLVVAEAEYTGQRVDAVERLAVVVIATVGIGHRALGVEALRRAEGVEVQAALDLGPLMVACLMLLLWNVVSV